MSNRGEDRKGENRKKRREVRENEGNIEINDEGEMVLRITGGQKVIMRVKTRSKEGLKEGEVSDAGGKWGKEK